MKIRLSTVAAALLILMIFPTTAAAHFFIDDGDIKALVHVDPEHQPVVGERATISFEISKRDGRLEIADYTVTIRIEEEDGGGTTFMTPRISVSDSITTNVVFTHQGVYKIVLVASAKRGKADFFRLQFIQRVEESLLKNDSKRTYWIRLSLFGSLAGIAIIVAADVIFGRLKNQNPRSQNEANS